MAKEKPVHEVRIGAIKAAIWKNHTTSGVRFNVTFARLYKEGNEWKSTDSYGEADLLVKSEVCRQAFLWIHDQRSDSGEAADKRPPKAEAARGSKG
jgi:hypothetical protein